jgi:hypothetical protein
MEVVANLVERLLNLPSSVERPRKRSLQRGFSGVLRNLGADLRDLARREAELIVIITDNDRQPPSERPKALRAQTRKASVSVPVVIGVAVQSLEAWLLADEQAIAQAVGAPNLPRQPDPETIDDAKTHFQELIGPYLSQNPDLEAAYWEQIAKSLDLQKVKKRCRSFQRFAQDLGKSVKISCR